ncbi:MAG: molybdate ABC transporter substrate-binding protein [Mesorhizobium sp.]|uniref:molybdate ABC transporter substrate-binding protein n=1 Tax=unclassified Mesorhizobium TaxID=325217 RepID=UPI000F75C8AF|nr:MULTISPECIES: molybdate ABC transporter substrate-binding protein [unclassified Mesorhizobium]AZO47788.1 molybdate ABC transporter substrate-binding protein [Mesorhizobium sp. M4B.F.Ca.ET.058.02.1.1]RVC41680.1 molybdate ABC transporter substrate-binding protein [Mesorhizobium sp. M4A.F.Ca.ET.090.04.2.1]RWC44794.1 MAG: molybdate ABC transporter substrate-binding protein [Mesorhizobium sp.]RWD13039.1 MAG: molybdate ABC transporter substrate-binding protein [Mesorhizobium sp.]RWD53866.1 MAG: m
MNQDIRLFGAIAVRPAVLSLISRFETATGFNVAVKWELNPTVKKQIEAGEPFDLVITNPHLVEDLIALGKVRAGSQVAFGRIAMGVAAKAGSRALDIGSVQAFGHALKSARSIAYASDGTSGGYFSGLLERLGISDEVKPKLVAIPGGQTAPAVGRGEAELGVVPVTSILAAAPEVMLVGRFPAELQSYIDFAIGISAHSTDAEAARQLSEFLMSPAVDGILAAKGVERH